MEPINHSPHSITCEDLKEAIYIKIQKSKAIITSTMFATELICDEIGGDNRTVFYALWAADDCLESIEKLLEEF